ncbi:MAG: proline--tRNA ligase [Fusobacteriota bacterium]
MKFSNLFVKTLKDDPKEAEVISHKLMLRSGMIKKLASGIYSYLPLGYKALKKVETIVREELDRVGLQELNMPVVQPSELWKETDRWDKMGDELMRIKDRHERDFVLGPTHEEVITDIVRDNITSYKELPINLYQIQTKFRDERRPRFGLMRGREFLMKDAYSFHTDEDSLEEEYQKMHKAYNRIFERCGLDFRAVEADSGAIGGETTHEIMVLADSGEDEVLYCNKCEYAANIEKAESDIDLIEDTEENLDLEKAPTPGKKSIKEVAKYIKVDPSKTVKSMLFKADDKFVMALVKGSYEVNEIKLKNSLNASKIELATEEEIKDLGLERGFLGPIDVEKIKIVADKTVKAMKNYITGGNEVDIHYKNTNHGRDYEIDLVADIRKVKVGEPCPKCDGKLETARGIEVGQIFKLGTKYSESMDCIFDDDQGETHPMVMGCYGIGVSRTMAAAIEQNYDKRGIIWPMSIAPYQVVIIPISTKDDEQMEVANKIHEELESRGVDVVLDDRDGRVGSKFADADLIGFPIKIVAGRGVSDGEVELEFRTGGDDQNIKIENIVDYVVEQIEEQIK